MKAVLYLERRATYNEYLAAEQSSAWRHEFIDGVIVAMGGGSDEHNAICSRLGGLCMARAIAPCRHYSPDQRFWIAATSRARYSDGSIICGPPQHPVHDGQATTNPSVVFEVLSPSTEGDDQGDKRADFQSLASLQAYVVAAQDERRVDVYRRDGRGDWSTMPDTYRDGQSVDLPMLGAPIAIADVYDGVLDSAGRSLLRS
jgi:Uma2 family endonuclease